MPRIPRHPALALTAEEKEYLDQLRQSRTAAIRDVRRARILWRYQTGETVTQIARAFRDRAQQRWLEGAIRRA